MLHAVTDHRKMRVRDVQVRIDANATAKKVDPSGA